MISNKAQTRSDVLWDGSAAIQPCPSCGVNQSVDCGFLDQDYSGEFDCTHPEYTICDSCPALKCYSCREKELKRE